MADYMIEGACNFCGQVQVLKCSDDLTGEAANDWITAHCKCAGAQRLRNFREFDGRVDDVLGEDAESLGFEPVDERTRNLALDITRAAYDGLCSKATLELPCRDKLIIARGIMRDGGVFVTIRRRTTKELS